MRTRFLPAIALVAALAALAGCGGSSDSRGASGSESTTTAPAATTAPSPAGTAEPTTTEPSTPKPRTITIRVVGGKPQGGILRPKLARNEKVVLVVRSDVADEVHLHGYDVSRPVAAGGTARLPFVAKIPGRFEVELEDRGVQIAELTVQ